MIFERWDIALASFPFVDLVRSKARPVVVLSTAEFQAAHHMIVVAMVTTAASGRLSTDVEISDVAMAGLRRPSVVRWKIMTLAEGLFDQRIGQVSREDQTNLSAALRNILPL